MARGQRFQSEGKVIYSISNEGMGIRFDNVESAEQITLNEWLMHASREAQERQLLKNITATGSGKRKTVFVLGVLVLVAIVAGLFAWLSLP